MLEGAEDADLEIVFRDRGLKDAAGYGSSSFTGRVDDLLRVRPVLQTPVEELPEPFASSTLVSSTKFATVCA